MEPFRYQPVPERTVAYSEHRYRNALYYGDASLGALMRGLRARHLDRDTLWIVVGDHGEAFGQHEGNYGHTFRLYDENVHVPFVVAAPGLLPGQIRSSRVVSLLDTAPTVLDLIGLGAQETHRTGQYFQGYQGRSVLDSEPRMAFFFADYSVRMFGVRDGSRKFIYELDSGRARLFDLDADPRERVDLSERFAAETHWYTSNLQSWSAAQKERVSRASAH